MKFIFILDSVFIGIFFLEKATAFKERAAVVHRLAHRKCIFNI